MVTKIRVTSGKKPTKKTATTKRAINKTIASLYKEAEILEKFVAGLDLVTEAPIARKKAVKKRAAKKVVTKKVAKKKVAKKSVTKRK